MRKNKGKDYCADCIIELKRIDMDKGYRIICPKCGVKYECKDKK